VHIFSIPDRRVNALHEILPSIEEFDCARHHLKSLHHHLIQVKLNVQISTRVVDEALNAFGNLHKRGEIRQERFAMFAQCNVGLNETGFSVEAIGIDLPLWSVS